MYLYKDVRFDYNGMAVTLNKREVIGTHAETKEKSCLSMLAIIDDLTGLDDNVMSIGHLLMIGKTLYVIMKIDIKGKRLMLSKNLMGIQRGILFNDDNSRKVNLVNVLYDFKNRDTIIEKRSDKGYSVAQYHDLNVYFGSYTYTQTVPVWSENLNS